MKIAAFIALSALTLSAFPVSYSFAEEAGTASAVEEEILSTEQALDLIMSAPAAKDATKGTVSNTKLTGYYDIRARQLAYREHVKAYRASLEARRVTYAKPQFDAAKNYRDTIAKVYAAEGEAAKKMRSKGESTEEVSPKGKKTVADFIAGARKNKQRDYSKEKPDITEEDMAANDADVSDDGTGLTEKPIPTAPDADATKKVVTSDDAPDFDPSDL